MVLYVEGDADGLCAVCARAQLEALRTTWLNDRERLTAEIVELRADLERAVTDRDELVLELERAPELLDALAEVENVAVAGGRL